MKILIDEEGKKIYCDESQTNDLQTYAGMIKRNDIANAKPGSKIKSHLKKEFTVIEADFADKIRRIKRGPQIITLKDAGVLSSYLGIAPGSKVLEAGAGSGALTCYLANLVKYEGKVYSYEIRKDFFELTQKNLESLGLSSFVELKNSDVAKAKEKDIDAAILDLPEPWHVLDIVKKALRPGGRLACYLPTTNQVIELLKSLEKAKLSDIRVIEIISRDWQVKKEAFRPSSEGIGHTAFLIFSRKIV